jgi:hypothetical protein
VIVPRRELPAELSETSGLALSRTRSGVLWTHNDSGNEPVVFAIDTIGRILGRVRVTGAALLDWEDMATGPCPSGHCLYIADIGDNPRARSAIGVYIVPEPDPSTAATDSARLILARYPDGPQDAEAIFVLPDTSIYLITKGRHGAIALYRFPPGPRQSGQVAVLERVREIDGRPRNSRDWVTGASASPNGRWVAVRSYRSLVLFETGNLVGTALLQFTRFDLTRLRERQGEAVAVNDSGEVWLTSESEVRRFRPTMTALQCRWP